VVAVDPRQAELWRAARHREYHMRQFREPYRSTVHLRECVRQAVMPLDRPYTALDVGCGAGANIFHLSEALPATSWVGVDLADDLLATARSCIAELGRPAQAQFVPADFFALTDAVPANGFDLVFSIQTLSWIPGYERLLPQLLSVVRPGGWVFVTSLFTDFLVDATIQINQLDAGDLSPDGPFHYNVYSMERFAAACRALGAETVTAADFAIDTDLQPPASRHMGTYTRTLADGSRLQFSGPLLMPWKVVTIRMGRG
jgi:ubiquinone/menaquinone biosynthesis C-methylase UbiE